MKKIGIVTALDLEFDTVTSFLEKPLKTDLYGHFLVKTYAYNGYEIIVIRCKIGEIMSSAATQLLISFGAELIVNYGLAGGYKNYSMGDSVVITSIAHYDFDTSKVDNVKVGHHNDMFDDVLIPTDQSLVDFATNLMPNLKQGILASGDKFIADDDFKNQLYNTFGAEVYDMEGAGVLIIAKNYNIPALIIKVISDSGDGKEYYDFVDLLKNTKHNFSLMLKDILDNLSL